MSDYPRRGHLAGIRLGMNWMDDSERGGVPPGSDEARRIVLDVRGRHSTAKFNGVTDEVAKAAHQPTGPHLRIARCDYQGCVVLVNKVERAHCPSCALAHAEEERVAARRCLDCGESLGIRPHGARKRCIACQQKHRRGIQRVYRADWEQRHGRRPR